MSQQDKIASHKERDSWDKADIILKPVGGLLTALSVALLGFFGSHYLNKRQTIDTNMRLYAELMSNREKSDSTLRKDMFTSIINSFLEPKKEGETEKPEGEEEMFKRKAEKFEQQILNLELLSYNFHDSLDVSPLFKHLNQKILTSA